MTLTVRDQISKKSSLPAIGDRKRFKLNGHSVLLTLNQLEVERKYDYDPAPGDDHAWYDVKMVWGEYKNG